MNLRYPKNYENNCICETIVRKYKPWLPERTGEERERERGGGGGVVLFCIRYIGMSRPEDYGF